MTTATLPSRLPDIRLCGTVDAMFYDRYTEQLARIPDTNDTVVIEVTSLGGDADLGRRIALDLRLLREQAGKTVFFLGKTVVYSAAVTIMSGVPASHRFLTDDCVLLIHERRMEKEVKFSGALRASIAVVRDLLAELENGQRLERAGFQDLIADTGLTMDTLMAEVLKANWYLPAAEALALRLIAGVV